MPPKTNRLNSLLLAQHHPRNTVCVRKHAVRQTTRAAVQLATDCAGLLAQAFGAVCSPDRLRCEEEAGV